MKRCLPEDTVDAIVPVPVDSVTLSRLVRLSKAIGKHPRDVAADLLHDILRDDEQAHFTAH